MKQAHKGARVYQLMAVTLAVMLWMTSPLVAGEGVRRGEMARELILTDINGKRHDLKDYRGKLVLINFWASWCPPCREEMPSLWRLKDKFRDKPFVVLTVNLGEPDAVVKAFLPEQMERDFVVLMDRTHRAERIWGPAAYPTTYVVDATGRVQKVLVGPFEWDRPHMLGVLGAMLPKQ